MKNILLWIWQLPQNLIGFILSRFCVKYYDHYSREKFFNSAVSLGDYRIFQENQITVLGLKHEFGHSIQSRILGPFYLIFIGLPSLIGNIWDRVFHKKWNAEKRYIWYYNLSWEKWADELADVSRF